MNNNQNGQYGFQDTNFQQTRQQNDFQNQNSYQNSNQEGQRQNQFYQQNTRQPYHQPYQTSNQYQTNSFQEKPDYADPGFQKNVFTSNMRQIDEFRSNSPGEEFAIRNFQKKKMYCPLKNRCGYATAQKAQTIMLDNFADETYEKIKTYDLFTKFADDIKREVDQDASNERPQQQHNQLQNSFQQPTFNQNEGQGGFNSMSNQSGPHQQSFNQNTSSNSQYQNKMVMYSHDKQPFEFKISFKPIQQNQNQGNNQHFGNSNEQFAQNYNNQEQKQDVSFANYQNSQQQYEQANDLELMSQSMQSMHIDSSANEDSDQSQIISSTKQRTITPDKVKYNQSMRKINNFRDKSPGVDYGLRKEIKSALWQPMNSAMGLNAAQYVQSNILQNSAQNTYDQIGTFEDYSGYLQNQYNEFQNLNQK